MMIKTIIMFFTKNMRTLYQFPLSPYCEKVRWILDFKELHYVAQNLTPALHRAFAQRKTKQNYLPILHDEGGAWVADSHQIALYLDDIYPEHRIIRPQRHLYDEILTLSCLADELGSVVRHWCLGSLVAKDAQHLNIMLGERGYLRQFEKITRPLLHKVMSRSFQLNNATKLQQSKQKMQQLISQFNEKIEQQGEFMVGGRLSLADMTLASMLAPILQLDETPWQQDGDRKDKDYSGEFCDYQAEIQQMAISQYVENLYKNHRHALVDWCGVD